MIRPVAVLRPEPGNAATVARLHRIRLTTIDLPLFEVAPLPWTPPSAAQFDGLLLTSANALRHGGQGLSRLNGLPALAVGEATAAAARERGFTVERTGDRELVALLDQVQPGRRLLWLAGEDRTAIIHDLIVQTIAVYRAAPRSIDAATAASLAGCVALLHSSRAAAQLATLVDAAGVARGDIRLAAISDKVARAAGSGWATAAVADLPNDEALIAAAHRLAIDP